MQALKIATDLIKKLPEKQFVIFTDLLSALVALKETRSNHLYIPNILKEYHNIVKTQK